MSTVANNDAQDVAASTWYVTQEAMKAALELTGRVFADNDVRMAIDAASRGVDMACGRPSGFYPRAAATPRYFTACAGCTEVVIDDCWNVSSVDIDAYGTALWGQAWIAPGDYVLKPYNAADLGRPYTSLKLNTATGRYTWPYGYPNGVRVTAKWGWPAVPAQIQELTLIVAAKMLRRAREAPFGVVSAGIEVGVAMRIARTDPDAAFLLQGLERNWVDFA